jgi:hypothetical protein
MPRAEFEPAIPIFERPNTVRASDRAAIGTSVPIYKREIKLALLIKRNTTVTNYIQNLIPYFNLLRFTPYIDEIIGDHQCGIQRNRSTIDHIFYLGRKWRKMGVIKILQKMGAQWERTWLFIDFKEACDSVGREALYDILLECGIPKTPVGLINVFK